MLQGNGKHGGKIQGTGGIEMEYKRFGDRIVLRLERGEEIVTEIETLCLKEKITLGKIAGIGATDDFTVGVFDLDTQVYHKKNITGAHEILSLTGNVTTKEDKHYSHMHIVCSNEKFEAVGGHLISCKISATAEIFIDIIEGKVERRRDDNLGINLMKF